MRKISSMLSLVLSAGLSVEMGTPPAESNYGGGYGTPARRIRSQGSIGAAVKRSKNRAKNKAASKARKRQR